MNKSQKVTFILFGISFLLAIDHLLVVPLVNEIIEDLKMKPSYGGLLISSYSLSSALAGILTASLSDIIGRKKIIVYGIIGFVFSSFACALAPTTFLLFAARILSGLFGGPVFANINAYVGDYFKVENRTKVMSVLAMSFSLSSVLGVPAGAYLTSLYSWRMPFLVIGVLGLPIIWGVYKYLEQIETGKKKGLSLRQEVKEMFEISLRPVVFFYVAGAFFMLTGIFGFISNISIWFSQNYHLNTYEIGNIFLVGGFASAFGSYLAGKFANRVNDFKIIIAGNCAMACAIYFYSNEFYTREWIAAGTATMMFSGGLRMPPLRTLGTILVPIFERGRIMSLLSVITSTGIGIGAFWAAPFLSEGFNGRIEGVGTIGLIGSIFTILGAIMIFFVNHLRHSKNQLAEVN